MGNMVVFAVKHNQAENIKKHPEHLLSTIESQMLSSDNKPKSFYPENEVNNVDTPAFIKPYASVVSSACHHASNGVQVLINNQGLAPLGYSFANESIDSPKFARKLLARNEVSHEADGKVSVFGFLTDAFSEINADTLADAILGALKNPKRERGDEAIHSNSVFDEIPGQPIMFIDTINEDESIIVEMFGNAFSSFIVDYHASPK